MSQYKLKLFHSKVLKKNNATENYIDNGCMFFFAWIKGGNYLEVNELLFYNGYPKMVFFSLSTKYGDT
jgi:hypothetical protein